MPRKRHTAEESHSIKTRKISPFTRSKKRNYWPRAIAAPAPPPATPLHRLAQR